MTAITVIRIDAVDYYNAKDLKTQAKDYFEGAGRKLADIVNIKNIPYAEGYRWGGQNKKKGGAYTHDRTEWKPRDLLYLVKDWVDTHILGCFRSVPEPEPEVEEPVEVVVDPRIAELEARNAALEARNAALEARVEELEGKLSVEHDDEPEVIVLEIGEVKEEEPMGCTAMVPESHSRGLFMSGVYAAINFAIKKACDALEKDRLELYQRETENVKRQGEAVRLMNKYMDMISELMDERKQLKDVLEAEYAEYKAKYKAEYKAKYEEYKVNIEAEMKEELKEERESLEEQERNYQQLTDMYELQSKVLDDDRARLAADRARFEAEKEEFNRRRST